MQVLLRVITGRTGTSRLSNGAAFCTTRRKLMTNGRLGTCIKTPIVCWVFIAFVALFILFFSHLNPLSKHKNLDKHYDVWWSLCSCTINVYERIYKYGQSPIQHWSWRHNKLLGCCYCYVYSSHLNPSYVLAHYLLCSHHYHAACRSHFVATRCALKTLWRMCAHWLSVTMCWTCIFLMFHEH